MAQRQCELDGDPGGGAHGEQPAPAPGRTGLRRGCDRRVAVVPRDRPATQPGDRGASGGGSGGGAERVPEAEPAPVAVASDAPRFRSLDDLVAASDVVVRGEVVTTERGRAFGEPGGATIVSRLVTLRVDEVLGGAAPGDDAVLVEEEGWLDDGRPLSVDGVAPTAEGDAGI